MSAAGTDGRYQEYMKQNAPGKRFHLQPAIEALQKVSLDPRTSGKHRPCMASKPKYFWTGPLTNPGLGISAAVTPESLSPVM